MIDELAEIEIYENRSTTVIQSGSHQVASAPGSETFDELRIVCRKRGIVRLSGPKPMEFKLLRMAPCGNGAFRLPLSDGEEVRVVSQCVVEAKRIRVVPKIPDDKLWVVVTCMGRLGNLKNSAPLFIDQKACEYVLVDWSCPDKCGDWMQSVYPDVRVVRVRGQTYFNQSAARNAGASVVPDGAWICFTDADILPNPRFCDRILARCNPGTFLRMENLGHNSGYYGTSVVQKCDYVKAGRFDEAFESYGVEDMSFYKGLEWSGAKMVTFPDGLIHHMDHPNSTRGIRNKKKPPGLNKKYSDAKWRICHRSGKLMSRQQGKSLYALMCDSDGCRVCLNPTLEMLGESGVVRFSLLGGLGDKLCGMSAVRAFARAHPNFEVSCNAPIVGWFRDGLVKYDRCGFHEIWGSEMHSKYLYNRASNTYRNYYGFFLDYLGFECKGQAIEMPRLDPHDEDPENYIVFHPFAVWAKNPPDSLVNDALAVLRDTGLPIVSVGTESGRLNGVDHRFSGRSAVRFCRMIANARAVVTARSAPSHVAPAYQVPTFCWNPDDKMDWHVDYPGVQRVLYGDSDLMDRLKAFLERLGLFVK